MVTKQIDVKDTNLEDLLAMLRPDVEILLMKEDKVLARLKSETPAQPKRKRIPGLHRGQIWVSDDFDDPLPDEFWLGDDA